MPHKVKRSGPENSYWVGERTIQAIAAKHHLVAVVGHFGWVQSGKQCLGLTLNTGWHSTGHK